MFGNRNKNAEASIKSFITRGAEVPCVYDNSNIQSKPGEESPSVYLITFDPNNKKAADDFCQKLQNEGVLRAPVPQLIGQQGDTKLQCWAVVLSPPEMREVLVYCQGLANYQPPQPATSQGTRQSTASASAFASPMLSSKRLPKFTGIRDSALEAQWQQLFKLPLQVYKTTDGNTHVTFHIRNLNAAKSCSAYLETLGIVSKTKTDKSGQPTKKWVHKEILINYACRAIWLTPDDVKALQAATEEKHATHSSPTKPVQAQLSVYPFTKGKMQLPDFLQNIKGFSISDINANGGFQRRAALYDAIKQQHMYSASYPKETTNNQQNVRVNYDSQILTPQDVANTLHTHEALNKWASQVAPVIEQQRRLTKHRIVTSPITAYRLDSQGKVVINFRFTMTTVAAPNFSKPGLQDFKDYTQQDGSLKQQTYQKALKNILKQALVAQDDARVQVVILPAIGVGVYIAALTPGEQNAARNMFASALQEALAETHFTHVQKVICSLPNEKDGGQNLVLNAVTSAVSGQNLGNVELTVGNIDVFAAAKNAADKSYNVGILNAGSDRTIGGKCEALPTTFEEQLFNQTDALFVQSIDYNPVLQTAKVIIPYNTSSYGPATRTMQPSRSLSAPISPSHQPPPSYDEAVGIAPSAPPAELDPDTVIKNNVCALIKSTGKSLQGSIEVKDALNEHRKPLDMKKIKFTERQDADNFVDALKNQCGLILTHDHRNSKSGPYVALTNEEIKQLQQLGWDQQVVVSPVSSAAYTGKGTSNSSHRFTQSARGPGEQKHATPAVNGDGQLLVKEAFFESQLQEYVRQIDLALTTGVSAQEHTELDLVSAMINRLLELFEKPIKSKFDIVNDMLASQIYKDNIPHLFYSSLAGEVVSYVKQSAREAAPLPVQQTRYLK